MRQLYLFIPNYVPTTHLHFFIQRFSFNFRAVFTNINVNYIQWKQKESITASEL